MKAVQRKTLVSLRFFKRLCAHWMIIRTGLQRPPINLPETLFIAGYKVLNTLEIVLKATKAKSMDPAVVAVSADATVFS